jgi:hypothetical protein
MQTDTKTAAVVRLNGTTIGPRRIGGLSRHRPVLLVADQAWDACGGGAVILKSLVGEIVGDGLVWVTPSRADGDGARRHYGLSAGSAQTGQFSVLKDTLWNGCRLADEVCNLASRLNACGIWVVLHGASVAIAGQLARGGGGLPYHATVHDDPVYATALRSRRLAAFAPLIAKQFRAALQNARSVDVVCDAMAARYRRIYGVTCSVLHRGLDTPIAESPKYILKRDGLRIGMLGNAYSYGQLLVLGRAVELAAARLSVRPRLLVCGDGFGSRLQRDFGSRLEVDVVGHVPEADGIERLRQCAALYLNYPFGWLSKVLRETSFPTKLSTYLCAARPIMIHAPRDSSVSGLWTTADPYVISWETMDPADGAEQLANSFTSPDACESFHLQAEAVRLRYYNPDRHRATLDRLLRPFTNETPELP